MRSIKIVLLSIFSLLLFGCSSTDIVISEEDALEVALDNESINEEDITDQKIKKNGDSYTITFNTKDGSYTYTVGTNGILTGKKFVPVETEEEESKEEEKKEEKTTNKATKPIKEDAIVSLADGITNADASKAYSTALNLLGISDSYSKTIDITEQNGNYVVKITLTNGDGITYVVLVNKTSFEVVDWHQE